MFMGDHSPGSANPQHAKGDYVAFDMVLPQNPALLSTVYPPLKAYKDTNFGYKQIYDTLHDLFLNQGTGDGQGYPDSILRTNTRTEAFQLPTYARVDFTPEVKNLINENLNQYRQCPAFVVKWEESTLEVDHGKNERKYNIKENKRQMKNRRYYVD